MMKLVLHYLLCMKYFFPASLDVEASDFEKLTYFRRSAWIRRHHKPLFFVRVRHNLETLFAPGFNGEAAHGEEGSDDQ